MVRKENLKQSPGCDSRTAITIAPSAIKELRSAARDGGPVTGLTHRFYRYPARFSPGFVGRAIDLFSKPGDVVLDPYMGGGTSIVEAYARGRTPIGCDLNSLAVFVSRAKVTALRDGEVECLTRWATSVVPDLSYHTVTDEVAELICPIRTKNLTIARARPAKKLIALALLSIRDLPTGNAQSFARAVLLNVAQWALHNRKSAPSLKELRARISQTLAEMITSLNELERKVRSSISTPLSPVLIHGTAATLPMESPFVNGARANLVITSPPYPGIHILYHRWQVDGRKETPAPYWIADCYDGKGASFYNFADRHAQSEDEYFAESLKTLCSIRMVMHRDAIIIQMIAFSNPVRQLPRYLENMRDAGFDEIRESVEDMRAREFRRIWRAVPARAWYAAQKGGTNSSREVVLLHRAD
jgi:DNA modification methylase